MFDESNPAGRLHTILKNFENQHDSATMRDIWSEALEVPSDDNASLSKAVIEVYSLSQEVKKLIKLREGDGCDIYLASFEKIEAIVLPINLNAQWHNYKKYLNSEVLTRLQFCAHYLSRFYKEESISNDEISDIKEKVEELYELIEKSTLSEEIKLILLEEMVRIKTAISYYKIKGAKGIKESLQATVGAIFANQDSLKSESDNNSEVLNRIGDLIDKLDAFTSKALKLHRIIKHPIKTLISNVTKQPEEMEPSATEA